MKSLEEQVAGKCVHFTGLMDKQCAAGVEYNSFGQRKLGVIPCLKGGTAQCDKCQFPSDADVQARLKEIKDGSTKALKLMVAAREHYGKTKEQKGKFTCPHGDHQAVYVRASTNGHFWISCGTCKINLNE